MYTVFSDNNQHAITEANINFYAQPFVHPKRNLSEHDFIYILQGEWKFGQNDEEYIAKKDDVLLLSANNTHYGILPCQPNTKTMYFHVTNENDFSYPSPHTSNCIKSHMNASANPNIKKYFSEIVNAKLQNKQKKADLYFQLLLYEICDIDTNQESNNIALHIKNIIHNNPEKFFGNAELSKMCKVSVKTAENKFKAVYGTTIHQYILNFKIEEAIEFFKKFKDMTIKEVAYNLGFYDEYHFSKQFKRIKGLSPSEYRKGIDLHLY